ncbi:MAG: hypothetical protein CNE91_01595 [SAR116 cluster bacterium MED-G04]|nr:hypothetical protein [SAR116 cluster bacterium]OUW36236.1 MAG: hypothetical protein CBD43_05370 [Gammaproteobacteria bacterium TMED183]PDH66015.1 MAG: hypothetical protein CNE91_01595 [SAR116 cluster bacterium MED-G04]HCD50638.1 hypothetical protein [Alphaproteobacteria bacterium]HCV63278.1 hypothetical protein [Alphaproteobacteria bacterium]
MDKAPDTTMKPAPAQQASADIERCLFCGMPEQLVWVHGHGQCAHCGVNAMPCCDGAACEID